jgi:hypothetical protein
MRKGKRNGFMSVWMIDKVRENALANTRLWRVIRNVKNNLPRVEKLGSRYMRTHAAAWAVLLSSLRRVIPLTKRVLRFRQELLCCLLFQLQPSSFGSYLLLQLPKKAKCIHATSEWQGLQIGVFELIIRKGKIGIHNHTLLIRNWMDEVWKSNTCRISHLQQPILLKIDL